MLHAGWRLAAAAEGSVTQECEVSEHVPQGEVGFVVGVLEDEGQHWSPLSRKRGAMCPPQTAEPDQESQWGASAIPSVSFLSMCSRGDGTVSLSRFAHGDRGSSQPGLFALVFLIGPSQLSLRVSLSRVSKAGDWFLRASVHGLPSPLSLVSKQISQGTEFGVQVPVLSWFLWVAVGLHGVFSPKSMGSFLVNL